MFTCRIHHPRLNATFYCATRENSPYGHLVHIKFSSLERKISYTSNFTETVRPLRFGREPHPTSDGAGDPSARGAFKPVNKRLIVLRQKQGSTFRRQKAPAITVPRCTTSAGRGRTWRSITLCPWHSGISPVINAGVAETRY